MAPLRLRNRSAPAGVLPANGGTNMKKYAYAWITLGFFLVSFILHWFFGWNSFVDEARQHGQTPEMAGYLNEMARDTFENWQSEFLQLVWQTAGLATFYFWGCFLLLAHC